MVWQINKLLSSHENLVFWDSSGFGFISISRFLYEWQPFEKKFPKSWDSPLSKVGQFLAFSTFGKNAWLWEAVVSKPLNPQETKGYQWKDNVDIFHFIPSGTLCDHWSGHRDALKTGLILYKIFFLQKVDGFPYVEASMSLPSLKGIFEYMSIRYINRLILLYSRAYSYSHSGLDWFCSTCKYALKDGRAYSYFNSGLVWFCFTVVEHTHTPILT